ncbi:MBL fold metallo-hydrolase [Clostridium chromiireducens]|uniref:Flavo-diiron protein FprA1 n=1 Tax=Clostridium chromiireducens TaxID=225345 RepID=A0A1V4IUD4_9CLOT|nr:MBL fold metallo-hydrolase [Clostridium chromiireducens]OPJ63529.1 flavo-diiron protein FprA1 [Clostridium chromiireducens]
MTAIYNDLHQFSNYVQPINLTFHQYLLSADDPLLVHTGNIHQAEALIPQLKEALNGKELKYIFISHFEGDECGGLRIILEHFPQAKPICSEVTARQLSGFGITDEFIIKRDGERLTTNEYELEFINYPSEMHLWGGLLILENKRNIFFSSDLMFNLGEASGTVAESNWDDEVNNISHEQVPDSNKRAELQQNLLKLNPKFIATGHGQCIKLL